VLLDTNRFYEPLVAQIERGIRDFFDDPEVRDSFALTADPDEAVALCAAGQSRDRGAR